MKRACICPSAYGGGCGWYACSHHQDGLPHRHRKSCDTPCKRQLRGVGATDRKRHPKCDDARDKRYQDPLVLKILEEGF